MTMTAPRGSQKGHHTPAAPAATASGFGELRELQSKIKDTYETKVQGPARDIAALYSVIEGATGQRDAAIWPPPLVSVTLDGASAKTRSGATPETVMSIAWPPVGPAVQRVAAMPLAFVVALVGATLPPPAATYRVTASALSHSSQRKWPSSPRCTSTCRAASSWGPASATSAATR